MKRAGSLFEKVVAFENLVEALYRAAQGKKLKGNVARYLLDLEKEVIQLQSELVEGTYHPRPYFQFTIFEPKKRNICSSNFRDRVVHHAISDVIEPYLERRFISDTYACRVGMGAHLALKRSQEFTRRYRHFLKCDISKYFESIDHARLKRLLSRIFKDSRLLALMDRIIDHGIPLAPDGLGLPIGNLTSQHFANLYLGELDHFVKERIRAPGYLRYMDDFILFHDSKDFLNQAHKEVQGFLERELALKLKDKVTVLAPTSQGVPFLGCRVFQGLIRLQRKNLLRMRQKIVSRERSFIKGRISEDEMVKSLNSVVAHAQRVNATHLLRREVLRSLKMA